MTIKPPKPNTPRSPDIVPDGTVIGVTIWITGVGLAVTNGCPVVVGEGSVGA